MSLVFCFFWCVVEHRWPKLHEDASPLCICRAKGPFRGFCFGLFVYIYIYSIIFYLTYIRIRTISHTFAFSLSLCFDFSVLESGCYDWKILSSAILPQNHVAFVKWPSRRCTALFFFPFFHVSRSPVFAQPARRVGDLRWCHAVVELVSSFWLDMQVFLPQLLLEKYIHTGSIIWHFLSCLSFVVKTFLRPRNL